MSVTMPVVVTILYGAELLAGRVRLSEPGFAEASDDEPAHPEIRRPSSSKPVAEHLFDISSGPRRPVAVFAERILPNQNFDFYDHKP
jgi:hypothetical protein